jgi:ribonuclease HII
VWGFFSKKISSFFFAFQMKRKAEKEKKISRKKFRTLETHPDGINGSRWPSELIENAIYLDEVGCGAWMGPLVIGATFLLPGFNVQGIHDSKKLKPHEREKVNNEIRSNPNIIFHVEHITNNELDEVGGLGNAWQIGMNRATQHLQEKLKLLNVEATNVIVDGNKTFNTILPIQAIEKADAIYIGVAAAAILAKVERDTLMESLSGQYPEFKEILKNGKGYRHSAQHSNLISQGIYTDLHRKTYNPLKTKLIPKVVTKRQLEKK